MNDCINHDDSISISEIVDSEELVALDKCIGNHKAHLSTQSRTAELWILYLYYIRVIKDFIACETTGDWERQLIAVGKLMNLRLYLQFMRELPRKHP